MDANPSPAPALPRDENGARREPPRRNERSYTARLFHLVAAVLFVAALYWAKEILLPFALAVLVSFLLNPMVTWLDRMKLGRVVSVISTVALMGLVVGAVGWLVTTQLMDLGRQLPNYRGVLLGRVRALSGATEGPLQEAATTIEELGEELAGTPKQPAEVTDEETITELEQLASGSNDPLGSTRIQEQQGPLARSSSAAPGAHGAAEPLAVKIVALPPSPLKQIRDWLGPLLGPLATFGLVAVLVIFMLLRREDLRYRLIQLFGISHMRLTTEALNDAAARVGRFLRMQLLINTCYGTAVGIGLYFIGVPNALLWGVLGLLLRFLPYAGPWLAALMPLTLTLAVFEGWLQPLLVVGLFLVLELTVNMLLEPWLYGASIGVSSMGIIVSAIFWTWLWGPIGLVMAMPLTVCIVVAAQYIPQMRVVTILLADQVTMSLGERIYQRLLAMDEDEAQVLALNELKNSSLAELYDSALTPALYLAEEERHAGTLSEQQQAFIFQAIRDLIDDCADEVEPDPEEERVKGRKVFCVPVRDEADEVASLMFEHLLRLRGYDVEMGSIQSTVGEVLEQIQQTGAHAVVLSVLPPLGARDGRYLCKRLRSQHPNLPIIAGLWSGRGMEQAAARLINAGANNVATSFASALQILEGTPASPRGEPVVAET